jgi:hypothetical protein
MRDSWCKPVLAKSGNVVTGGAARNVRLSELGGMDQIITDVARRAAEEAWRMAEEAIHRSRRGSVKRVS